MTKYIKKYPKENLGRPKVDKFLINCLNCKKDFSIYNYQLKFKKFCSAECSHEYSIEKIICKQCNKLFQDYKGNKRKFCSKSCRMSFTLANLSVEEKITRLKKALSTGSNRPNKFEIKVADFLNLLNFSEFKYTGDGSLFINGRSPDFVNERYKIVVLANGDYWHLGQYGIENTEENKKQKEQKEAQPFLEKDYSVIFIWSDKTKNKLDMRVYIPKIWTDNGFSYNYQTNLENYTVYN